jgi:flagellar motor component MotA
LTVWEPTSIKDILDTEIENKKERHKLGVKIRTMGTFGPAMGMLGTL